MYIALYRKWRPTTFDDVIEQSGVVSILKNSVKQDRIGHAYLFCGTRGTGKTTIAKIYSRAINCLAPKDGNPCNECEVCEGILNQSLLDVIEIDAASNNGVDNIRDIIEEIAYVPARARYKVYIIDEVHMLSTGAFNALLKTLEEPPGHAVFLLATTDPQKLPATILSRCQRFEFKRISPENIVKRLEIICKDENTEADKDALFYIAQAADGALRDAISILDQCISMAEGTLKLEDVLNILGAADESFLAKIAESVIKKDVEQLLLLVDQMIKEGKEIPDFISSLIVFFRNMLVLKATGDESHILGISAETKDSMKNMSAQVPQSQIIEYIRQLSMLERDIKWSSQKKIILEVGLIKLCMEEQKPVQSVQQAAPVQPSAPKQVQPPNIQPVQTRQTQPAVNNRTNERPTGLMAKLKPVEEEYLRDIFIELKEGKHMMITSYLRNVRALYHSDSVVYLVFCGAGKETKKDSMAKPENMKIINSIFQKTLARDCAVKLYIDDELSEKTETEDENDVINRISKLTESGIQVEFE